MGFHQGYRCPALSLHVIHESSHADLLVGAPDSRSKALALSSAIRHAGDWLNVVLSRALGLHLRDQEFRLCLQYWLGLPIAHCPICQVAADPFGDHQVGCGGNGDRMANRYNAHCRRYRYSPSGIMNEVETRESYSREHKPLCRVEFWRLHENNVSRTVQPSGSHALMGSVQHYLLV